MIRCHRCGIDTPRLTVAQTRCPACSRDVARLIESDERRRSVVRFQRVREMTGTAA